MVSYCSLSNDRSLTKILIENSFKNNGHQFVNTSEWIDGLDHWLTNDFNKMKYSFSKQNYFFDENIGIYLPKLNSKSIEIKNNFIETKSIEKINLPERFKQSNKKDVNSYDLSISDQSLNLSNEQLSSSEDNLIQKKSSNKLRFPLRQIESRHNCRIKDSSNNREKFQYLLREQMTTLLTRETTNLSSKRTVIKIPSVEIKHETTPLIRTRTQIDPKLIMERYAKVEQMLISPTQNQLFDINQSPILVQQTSSFGLTVTPLDFSSSKQHSSLDQHENSLKTIRPSTTQQGFVSSSIDEQKTILLKHHFEKGFISSSTNIYLSNKNSNNEQIQINNQKSSHHLRFSSKTAYKRPKTFQFLPHITGKRIQINFSNQNDS